MASADASAPARKRALLVVVDADGQRERVHRRSDRTRPDATQLAALTGHGHLELDTLLVAVFEQVVRVVGHVEVDREIRLLEQQPELLRGHLGLGGVHGPLHDGAELHLHAARHHHAVVALQ